MQTLSGSKTIGLLTLQILFCVACSTQRGLAEGESTSDGESGDGTSSATGSEQGDGDEGGDGDGEVDECVGWVWRTDGSQVPRALQLERAPNGDAYLLSEALLGDGDGDEFADRLTRLDPDGEEAWSVEFEGEDGPLSMAVNDSGVFLRHDMYVDDLGTSSTVAVITKIEQDGGAKSDVVQFEDALPSSPFVADDSSNLYFLFEGDSAEFEGRDVTVRKVDSPGATVWETTFGGPNNDRPDRIALLPDGGVIVTGVGVLEDEDPEGGDPRDIFLARLDADGNLLWNSWKGDGSFWFVTDLVFSAPDRIYVAGSIPAWVGEGGGVSSDTPGQPRLFAFDLDGNALWEVDTMDAQILYPHVAALPSGAVYFSPDERLVDREGTEIGSWNVGASADAFEAQLPASAPGHPLLISGRVRGPWQGLDGYEEHDLVVAQACDGLIP